MGPARLGAGASSVMFTPKDDALSVYELADHLRHDGWIVPAYALPPDAQDTHVMRVDAWS